jgi:hypothetical protein
VKHESALTIAEIEAELGLARTFLRAALAVAGGTHSSPEATRVAGNEAARLKQKIADLERHLPAKAA